MNDQQTIGTLLRGLRESRGMKLRAAARAIDAWASDVSRWERGQRVIPIGRLVDLLDLYGVPVEERGRYLVNTEPAEPSEDAA